MKKAVLKLTIFSDDLDSTIESIVNHDDILSVELLEESDSSPEMLDAWHIEEFGEPYYDPYEE